MKFLLLITLLVATLPAEVAPKLNKRFKDSNSCKSCHYHILKHWRESWHAKSHYNSNEYFKKSIDYIHKKEYKSTNSIKVSCAKCHNPRISITSTDEEYEYIAALHLDSESNITKAVSAKELKEGINCLVCHNIDAISDQKNRVGIDKVTWTEVGTVVGPFSDAKSPYHKSLYRDHFGKDSDKLCLLCHGQKRSLYNLTFADLTQSYRPKDKRCVDCHMGEKELHYASIMAIDSGKKKRRDIRKHTFSGAHTESMWRDALDVTLKSYNNTLYITITNSNPHEIPSGFGARELILEVRYIDYAKKSHLVTKSLSTHYKDKKGRATIAHLAVSKSKKSSIDAYSKKIYKLPIIEGAILVEVRLYYRLVNDEVRRLLKLEDPIYKKKFLIQKRKLYLSPPSSKGGSN